MHTLTTVVIRFVFVVGAGVLWGGVSSGFASDSTSPGIVGQSSGTAGEKPLTAVAYCLRRSLEFTNATSKREWRSACRENYGSDATSVPLDSVEKGNIDAVINEALEQEARVNVRLEYCLRRAGDITNSKNAVLFARVCESAEEEYRIGKAPEPAFEQSKREIDDVVAIMNSGCAALSTKELRTTCFQEWWNGVLPQLVALVKRDYPTKVKTMTREYQQCFETMAESKQRLQDCIKGKMQILYVSPSAPPPQQGPSIWDRIAAALYSPSAGGYSYPLSSTPPGFKRDLNGNLRAQTPNGSNEFFDRELKRHEQRQQQQQEKIHQEWRQIPQRSYR